MGFLEDKENLLIKSMDDNKKVKEENKELKKELEKIKELLPPRPSEKEFEPLELKDKPSLIGLNNIGATCFMNATLQCLSNTKHLTNYFLKKKHRDIIINNNIAIKNKNEPQLSPVYLELLKKLWDDSNISRAYSPHNFMTTIEKLNPLFKKGQAGDSKDFIIFILEQFHKELKKPVKKINNNKTKTLLDQYDKNNAFEHFFDDFQKECSIISDLFFGFNETTNVCLFCKNNYNLQGKNYPICYNYGIFNCIILPLQEVNNMKKNEIQFSNFNNVYQYNRVSIYDCFLYNQKSEHFTGDNKNYCNICKQLFDSIYTSKIISSPNYLILILKRGKDNIYNVKIDFTEEIDISDYVFDYVFQQKPKPKMIYNLYGVITHIGQSGPNAHFVAFCKSPIDNKWYKYNDAFVNSINDVQNEVIDFCTPYILFYQKKNE